MPGQLKGKFFAYSIRSAGYQGPGSGRAKVGELRGGESGGFGFLILAKKKQRVYQKKRSPVIYINKIK